MRTSRRWKGPILAHVDAALDKRNVEVEVGRFYGERNGRLSRREAPCPPPARDRGPRGRLTSFRGRTYHSPGRRIETSRECRLGRSGSPVIDLTRARDARRLEDFRDRSRAVLDTNRRALAQLFQTGLIYSRTGARLGRDLLLAHQHLLKVGDLLARLGERPPRRDGDVEALYAEVQGLLARTSELTARSDVLLARQR